MLGKIDLVKEIPPVSSPAKGRRVGRREEKRNGRGLEKQPEVTGGPPKKRGRGHAGLGHPPGRLYSKADLRETAPGDHQGERPSDAADSSAGSLINIRV